MTLIKDCFVRKIIDSRGKETIEVEVLTMNGIGRASSPSGASTGEHEVVAFPKRGVDFAIQQFNEKIRNELIGMDSFKQKEIDALLKKIDGTENFANIGGNLAIAISLANAKACANSFGLPLYRYLGGVFAKELPLPMGNVIGGGKHAISGTDIQEYLVVSFGKSFSESAFTNALVHNRVKEKLKEKFKDLPLGKGDEGAWVSKLGNEESLQLVYDASKEISKEKKFEVRVSLDVAGSSFYKNGKYVYKERELSKEKQIDFLIELIEKYNLYSVEDGLEENDFEGHAELTKQVGNKCLIIGDDLFTTNKNRLKKGIELKSCNAILIKPNQIGTLTETIETVKLARENGYKIVISHRSGETEDNTIAHLSVAFNSVCIKTGTVGGERTAKLNELIRIEEELRGV